MVSPEYDHLNHPDFHPKQENFNPGHFYAAYVFDHAENRKEDVRKVLEEARILGYPVRHWWLSDAMDIQGYPDRLIVCVHHPSNAFDAGIYLYNALHEQKTEWDDLEAAAMFEYLSYGRPTSDISNLTLSTGKPLFST